MELASKNAGAMTPVKESPGNRSKNQACSKHAENFNPNLSRRSPGPKSLNSPATAKSAKSLKSASKNPNPGVCLPHNKVRQRRFVTAKKNPKKDDDEGSNSTVKCKCKDKAKKKCLCVAYENLRASQEEFFKNQADKQNQFKACDGDETLMTIQDLGTEEDGSLMNEAESPDQAGSSTVKRRRDKLLEEARRSVPDGGLGRVMHLVNAFEKLLTIQSSKDRDGKEVEEKQAEDNNKKAMKWALPGLQFPPKAPVTEDSSSSFCPSDLFLTSESLGLDPPISFSFSWDDNHGSTSSRTSNGGRRSRRNSLESSCTTEGRRRKKKQLIGTSQKPFKLRTEQRGKLKEEEFMKKVQEIMIEEEKQRIPVAQGLPWTTEEPENLVKPAAKEITRPIDLKLYSDLRAIDRAEFDHQVAEKLSFIEQYKMEREKQQKLAEDEEIRRLRKDLIPKAQPMPHFDRPFIPRRSTKHPTISRDPKFQNPQNQNKKDQALLIME